MPEPERERELFTLFGVEMRVDPVHVSAACGEDLAVGSCTLRVCFRYGYHSTYWRLLLYPDAAQHPVTYFEGRHRDLNEAAALLESQALGCFNALKPLIEEMT